MNFGLWISDFGFRISELAIDNRQSEVLLLQSLISNFQSLTQERK